MGTFSSIRARAVYASDPANCRGRRIAQPSASERSPFQRDKDRIIHSSAFRRLKGKTQVFVSHEGDYYRTRLTHSLEVAQIARSIARVLGLDEDLAECLALAHDMGHPPFGHSGEDALAKGMLPYGGFDHNAQTLRIVEQLESRYAEFDGLNLTWETLEGIAKHNGPLIEKDSDIDDLPWALKDLPEWEKLELNTFAGPEAQVAALADDIAYNNHDIDDGLRAGLFTVADVCEVLDFAIVDFSDNFRSEEGPMRKFLFDNMYRHYKVNRMMGQGARVIEELFDQFINNPDILPTEFRNQCNGPRNVITARVVCDYIASMTDSFAINEHKKLFSVTGYL